MINLIKNIILLTLLTYFVNADASTCTQISRSNYSANQLLTSTALNADFNQLVTGMNAYDAGCVTDNTLELDALNTTQFAPILNAPKTGCGIRAASATTATIGNCKMMIGGNYVNTATTTTVQWTDLDTGSEATNTVYYIYADSTSSGTTLTPVLSVTPPSKDGYKSSDRVLGKIYNDDDGTISSSNVYDFANGQFVRSASYHSGMFAVSYVGSAFTFGADESVNNCYRSDVGVYSCIFNTNFWAVAPKCLTSIEHSAAAGETSTITALSNSSITVKAFTHAGAAIEVSYIYIKCEGYRNAEF